MAERQIAYPVDAVLRHGRGAPGGAATGRPAAGLARRTRPGAGGGCRGGAGRRRSRSERSAGRGALSRRHAAARPPASRSGRPRSSSSTASSPTPTAGSRTAWGGSTWTPRPRAAGPPGARRRRAIEVVPGAGGRRCAAWAGSRRWAPRAASSAPASRDRSPAQNAALLLIPAAQRAFLADQPAQPAAAGRRRADSNCATWAFARWGSTPGCRRPACWPASAPPAARRSVGRKGWTTGRCSRPGKAPRSQPASSSSRPWPTASACWPRCCSGRTNCWSRCATGSRPWRASCCTSPAPMAASSRSATPSRCRPPRPSRCAWRWRACWIGSRGTARGGGDRR